MNLIDQYIAAVTSYLPASLKKKASKIISHQIYLGLPQNHTELDIHNELQKLGSPQDFARDFRSNQYLLGPGYYPQFLTFLQKTIPFISLFFLLGSVLNMFFQESSANLLLLLLNHIIIRPLMGSIQFAIFVLGVFIILEKKKIPLPESILIIPKPKSLKVQKEKPLFPLFLRTSLLLLFMFIVLFYPHFIAWYPREAEPIPLFYVKRLQAYQPIIFIMGLSRLILFMVNSKSGKTIIFDVIFHSLLFVFMLLFATDEDILNPQIFNHLSHLIIMITLWLPVFWIGYFLLLKFKNFRKKLATTKKSAPVS